ncbi:MAG: hypothetical protein ACRDK4_01105 [Solirubrobacteraceae bacterium]
MGQMPAPSGTPSSAYRTVLTDTRGPFTMVIFQNATNFWSCFPEAGATAGASGAIPATPASGRIAVSGEANSPADPYTVIYGRVGAGLREVSLVLADGSKVKSTVTDGWFAAWWPGDRQANAVELGGENGLSTQALHLPWQ